MAMIANIELFDSCVSSAVRINKIKLNSAEKSIFYVFFLASTLLEKKLCRLVVNDFGNKSELNWELRIKGG